MTDHTKTCRDCSAPFKPSRTDSTVRCPACRAARRPTSTPTTPDPYQAPGYISLKLAALKARSEYGYDSPQAREALARFVAAKPKE